MLTYKIIKIYEYLGVILIYFKYCVFFPRRITLDLVPYIYYQYIQLEHATIFKFSQIILSDFGYLINILNLSFECPRGRTRSCKKTFFNLFFNYQKICAASGCNFFCQSVGYVLRYVVLQNYENIWIFRGHFNLF